MKKITYLISGLIAGIVGLSFIAKNQKTEFQKKLEKKISVDIQNNLLANVCGGHRCPEKKYFKG